MRAGVLTLCVDAQGVERIAFMYQGRLVARISKEEFARALGVRTVEQCPECSKRRAA
jgi:hypothetical protein